MYPKINEKFINKLQNSIEGKDFDIKSIIKIINNQSLKNFNNPFSNIILKNTLINPKIKSLNRIRKNNNKKKEPINIKTKRYLTLNEYKYYYNNDNKSENVLKSEFTTKFCDKEKPNLYKRLNNFNTVNKTISYNDDNFFKNMKNRFYKNKKMIIKPRIKSSNKRNIRTFNNENNNNNREYSKNYKNNRISITDNNKYEEINKIKSMNFTTYYKPNEMKYENKTIQTSKIISPKIINEKKNNKLIKYPINHFKNNSQTLKIKSRSLTNSKNINADRIDRIDRIDKIDKIDRIDKIKSLLFFSNKNLSLKNNKKFIIRRNDKFKLLFLNDIIYIIYFIYELYG